MKISIHKLFGYFLLLESILYSLILLFVNILELKVKFNKISQSIRFFINSIVSLIFKALPICLFSHTLLLFCNDWINLSVFKQNTLVQGSQWTWKQFKGTRISIWPFQIRGRWRNWLMLGSGCFVCYKVIDFLQTKYNFYPNKSNLSI